ncbi:MAG: transketolase [Mollicutes bacterium]|nr:transketolase [Mollicutes bacterium]
MAIRNDKKLNTVKLLALDMINEAESGNPGIVLSASPILYSLYLNHLNTISKIPKWINRDRFIMSCGHGSAMYYSMLHLAGYNLSLEDLKRFRQIDSFTPGHPEMDPELGIEATTGPLGQGIATAVGVAMAERYYENLSKKVDPKSKLIDFYTYVLCSDGDLDEGISYEALAFAAKQKLNKLIVLYDSNDMNADGPTYNSTIEDIEDRFDALDFNVIYVKNGHNLNEVSSAIKEAKRSKYPSIIIFKTILGKDLKKENNNILHAGGLDEKDIIDLKVKYGLPKESFSYDEKIKEEIISSIDKRVSKKYEAWLKEYDKAKKSRNPDLVYMINLLENDQFIIDFDSNNYKINNDYFEDGRLSNQKVLNFISPKTKFFLGGSSNIKTLTKAYFTKSGISSSENPLAKNIAFGIREHAMAGILGGMALCGLRVFSSTFLAFADYMKPAMRVSAMMNLPITYIFTHDSISIGQDGPTFQPIEQLTMLRSIPNMKVFRPCDIKEIIGSWEYILKNKGPSCLIISKEKMIVNKHTNGKYVQYGAYIVRKEKEKLSGVLIATGSEVAIALKAAEELFTQGIDLRVVSMPCMELFLKQTPIYEEKLFPKEVKIITLEAGSSMIWNRFATNKDCAIGVDEFGISGKKDDVLKYLNFDYNSILYRIKKNFD